LDPNSGWNFSQLIDILISTKQFDEAAILWQQAQQRFPTHDEVVLSGGHLHRMLDNFPEAIRLYRQAHLLLPSSTRRIRLLASALQEAGELTEAESLARKAWNQEPKEMYSARRLIVILMDKGEYEEAETLIRAALRRHAKAIELLLLKIENLLRVGDYSAVVENCLETVQTRKRIDPLAKESIALLQAEAYLHLCQPVLAIHCLESVENPVGKIELEVLRVLADPEKLCEFTENPIIKRLMLIQKVRQQLSLHNLTIWPDLPQTGLSRWNRQTGLLLQAEYLRPHQPTKAEALVQQAQALSHCNFTRINALLSLAREKHLL
jgi:tetratricopeptide (TPR) repeat protein